MTEHDLQVVEGIPDRVVALDHGIRISEGTFEQVATDPRLVCARRAWDGSRAAKTCGDGGAPSLR